MRRKTRMCTVLEYNLGRELFRREVLELERFLDEPVTSVIYKMPSDGELAALLLNDDDCRGCDVVEINRSSSDGLSGLQMARKLGSVKQRFVCAGVHGIVGDLLDTADLEDADSREAIRVGCC
ncbi:hypothetical protein ACFL3C_01870 [Patescibacteria group bacterium]